MVFTSPGYRTSASSTIQLSSTTSATICALPILSRCLAKRSLKHFGKHSSPASSGSPPMHLILLYSASKTLKALSAVSSGGFPGVTIAAALPGRRMPGAPLHPFERHFLHSPSALLLVLVVPVPPQEAEVVVAHFKERYVVPTQLGRAAPISCSPTAVLRWVTCCRTPNVEGMAWYPLPSRFLPSIK